MIDFVEKKSFDPSYINHLLEISKKTNHWSNFGPVYDILENNVCQYLKLNNEKSIIITNSGTTALFALVEMHNILRGKELKWVVCSFGFYCSNQGPLRNAKIVDCNEKAIIDIELLKNMDFDGLVITNPFGVVNNIDEYVEFCNKNKKTIICDSCSSFDAFNNHTADEALSFHHTKPWGFGEGGCAIVDRKNKELFRSLINFGKNFDENIKKNSTNGKISDISCAFILDRLRNISEIKRNYIHQYERILKISEDFGFKCLIDRKIDHIPHSVPLIYEKNLNINNPYVKIHKYYQPLDSSKKANEIYNKIINFPCHSQLIELDDTCLINVFSGLTTNL